MSADDLIAALPDFVAFVNREGIIVEHMGGRRLEVTAPPGTLDGQGLADTWPGLDGTVLLQAIRKAIAIRGRVECGFESGGRQLKAQFSAAGPERTLCIVSVVAHADPHLDDRDPGVTGEHSASVDRRGFLKRFQQSVADAALRERPLAVCLVFLDGLPEIGTAIDYTIAENVVTTALLRLPAPGAANDPEGTNWYLGQLGEAFLAVVIEGSNGRNQVERIAARLAESFSEPVPVGDAAFTLRPSIGIALMGQDATRPQALLECARAAMTEARRKGAQDLQFYSDTMRLRPMLRLDIERELRVAISGDELQLRYVGRHDLDTGRLEAIHAYLRWPTPLRGDVPPARFLPIAENTGLALQMSQWALDRLRQDWQALRAVAGDPAVRISFGALRHHLLGDALAEDLEVLGAAGALQPKSLEIRINEGVLAALPSPEQTLGRLSQLGVHIVIDEFGCSSSSMARLAHLPVQALQVDRSFVVGVHEDPAAARVCWGTAGIAQGLGLAAHAAGIDDEHRCELLLHAGYRQGLGDHFPRLPAIGRSDGELRRTA